MLGFVPTNQTKTQNPFAAVKGGRCTERPTQIRGVSHCMTSGGRGAEVPTSPNQFSRCDQGNTRVRQKSDLVDFVDLGVLPPNPNSVIRVLQRI